MAHFKTIITGHGHFATGLQSAVELLAGEQATLQFIDFTSEMTDTDLAAKLTAAIDDQPTLIFTDLLGGTPYKEAAKIAFTNQNVAVVTGCNLGSLLDALFTDFTSLPDYAQALVATTNRSAQVLDLTDSSDEEEPEDGI